MSLKDKLDRFFIIVPVGFEDHLEDELRQIQPWLLGADMRPSHEELKIENKMKGGIEILTHKNVGFQLNHFLKTPVRILWRWKSKKISHVSEMKSWIRGLRPQEIVEGSFRLQISAKKSRLQNEKMLTRVFSEDWKGIQEESKSTLYVDVYDDQMTLSWDTSGDPLYKRGWSEQKGTAPLRENFAHLLLMDLVKNLTGPELQKTELVDPMMGSGSFLLESLGWNSVVNQREFAYQAFKSVPSFLKTEWWTNHPRPERHLFGSHLGLDIDPKMVNVARNNLKRWGEGRLELHSADLLKTEPEISGHKRKFLISNPPYGERMAVDSVQNLISAALKTYNPERALFVVPKNLKIESSRFQLTGVREFLNGGLEVKSLVFSRAP